MLILGNKHSKKKEIFMNTLYLSDLDGTLFTTKKFVRKNNHAFERLFG